MPEPMEPKTVRIPPGMWAEAEPVAEKRGERVADMIRRALRQYIKTNGGRP